jgi:flagellar biosynthesis chaperone FliJ
MEEHNRKKEEKEKRDIAELKAARENAERKLAELTDKHEKTQDELSKIGLGHYLEQRELESVIVGHEMELAKQKDLVEALNQELDDQDHELSLERSRYFTHTTVLRQLLEHERQHPFQGGIRMPVRRRR